MLRTNTLRKILLIGFLTLLIASQAGTVSAGNNVWTSNGPEGGVIFVLAIDPTIPSTLYAGTSGNGVFKSTNGGGVWSAVIFTGMTGATVQALAIDPTTPTTLYAGIDGGGVAKSTDSGDNWVVNTDLTQYGIYALAIDPTTTSTIYAGTSNGGVFKSTNGGDNWNAVNTGLSSTQVRALVFDPMTPGTLYAGTGGGVFMSTNGGDNWSAAGLNGYYVRALTIDPTTSGTLYAGTPWGVYKSTNGGGVWNAVNTGLISTNVYALAIDSTPPATLYAGTDGGVFMSTDDGGNWNAVNNGLTSPGVHSLAIDHTTPSTLYAGTDGGGVFAIQQISVTKVTVGGVVLNMVTNSPMSGVTIKLYFGSYGGSQNYTATSDVNGSFSFSNIPSGTYAIVPFPPTGYIGEGEMITVGNSDIDNILLTLIKDVPLLSPANNAIVEDPKPYLCWEAMPQAVSYRLQLNRQSDWSLIANPQVSSSCYQVTETLENNVIYSWSLANVLNAQGQNIGGSGSFSFTYKTGPVSQPVSSATSTDLSSLDGTIMIHFPIGAFSGTGTVTYQRDSGSVMTQSLADIQKTYEISSTVPLAAGATYSVTITYNPLEIQTIKPGSLALYYWDDIQNQWVIELTSSLDETNHRVTASPNHLSKWAVLGETSRIFLPIIIK